jgi:hypothetical protein
MRKNTVITSLYCPCLTGVCIDAVGGELLRRYSLENMK